MVLVVLGLHKSDFLVSMWTWLIFLQSSDLSFSSGICVGVHWLPYTLYHRHKLLRKTKMAIRNHQFDGPFYLLSDVICRQEESMVKHDIEWRYREPLLLAQEWNSKRVVNIHTYWLVMVTKVNILSVWKGMLILSCVLVYRGTVV